MKKCPYCGAQMNDDSIFCTECGKPIPQGKTCPNCGASINSDDLFCQNCGHKIEGRVEVSETNSFQKKCPKCGAVAEKDDIFCQNCGCNIDDNPVLNDDSILKGIEEPCDIPQKATNNPDESIPKIQQSKDEYNTNTHLSQVPTSSTSNAPISQHYAQPTSIPEPLHQEEKKSNAALIAIIALLLIIGCGVGGYFYYDKIYLPEKIDREAPRYYTMANVVVLRSSRSAGADFNKVASLPYGTELITYEHDNEWSRVKVNALTGDKQEGYVASAYILSKTDFFLMNSIFGNQDSKEAIVTTKCRIALLNYFKERGYIGKMDDQIRLDAGITTTPNRNNQWQVFTKPKDAKPNSVLFKRLYNKNSQFTDFAVIITNSITEERRLLYFYFDEDETPHLLTEQDAPLQGYIVNATYDYDYYSGSKVLDIGYSY